MTKAASIPETAFGAHSGRLSRAALIETLARNDVASTLGSPGVRSLADAAALARDIAGAEERGELLLHYQPIQDLRTGECRRVEALLRWQHPQYGLILPGEFLPLASRLGRLERVGRWVMAAAFQQSVAWRSEGLGLAIAINLSSSELASPATLHALVAQLSKDTSDSITLEVDATAMARGEVPHGALFRLFAAGARVALDDVTLATAPGRLIANRVDEIKLSRRLVQRASSDRSAQDELASLVDLARKLHLAVVAVGVEDKRTRDIVAALGCDFAQGYWVSHPLLPDKVMLPRRWAAGLVLSGALAMTAHVGTSLSEPRGPAPCASAETVPSPVSSLCAIAPADRNSSAPGADGGSIERLQIQTGTAFLQQPSARTSVIADARLAPSVRSDLADSVDGDMRELEQRFGRRFERPPTVYLFASRSTFAIALDRFFGARGSESGLLAAANGGVTIPRQNAIAINLQNVPSSGSSTIIQHELTHVLVREIAGANAVLPAWFDEGLATIEQETSTLPDGGARARAVTVALLKAQETSLADLADATYWTQRNAALNGQAYLVAATAVRLMEERVSRAGIVRMLTSVRHGRSFAEAYADEAGESLREFVTVFEGLASSDSDPQITVSPAEDGVLWTLSGFTAETVIAVQIDGRSYRLGYPATTDRYGVYQAVFGSTAPPGDYVVRVSGGGRTATETLRTGEESRPANGHNTRSD
jgi:EAL domain-containing protein (putative c-di-GMP-specific phosphodiesterase class I)